MGRATKPSNNACSLMEVILRDVSLPASGRRFVGEPSTIAPAKGPLVTSVQAEGRAPPTNGAITTGREKIVRCRRRSASRKVELSGIKRRGHTGDRTVCIEIADVGAVSPAEIVLDLKCIRLDVLRKELRSDLVGHIGGGACSVLRTSRLIIVCEPPCNSWN